MSRCRTSRATSRRRVDESTWVLTSYLVSNAIILPMGGWFSMLIGRKRFYMIVRGAVHAQLAAVRTGALARRADRVPRSARDRRRRAAADVAGHPGGELPARKARHGDGGVWHGRGGRARHRADPRRMDHRQLQLALDFPDQSAVRHPLAAADGVRWSSIRRISSGAAFATVSKSITSASDCWPSASASLEIVLDEGQRKDWFSSRFIVTFAADHGVLPGRGGVLGTAARSIP